MITFVGFIGAFALLIGAVFCRNRVGSMTLAVAAVALAILTALGT